MKNILISILLLLPLSGNAQSFSQIEIITSACMSEITSNKKANQFLAYIESANKVKVKAEKERYGQKAMQIFEAVQKKCDRKGIVKSGGRNTKRNLYLLYASILGVRDFVLKDPNLKLMAR